MILDYLPSLRLGVYYPKTKFSMGIQYSSERKNHFKISASIELAGKGDTFITVKEKLTELKENGIKYLEDNDMKLLEILLDGGSSITDKIIHFDENGITLASLITIDAKEVSFIYEKNNNKHYALQFALTPAWSYEDNKKEYVKSSIKFPWSDSKLVGEFYFNYARNDEKYQASITGYVDFHLGNKNYTKHLTMSVGFFESTSNPKKEKIIYAVLRSSKGISVRDLVSMITPDSVTIPDFLNKINIYDFGVSYTTSTSTNTSNTKKEPELKVQLDADFVLDKVTIGIHLQVTYIKKNIQFKAELKAKNGLSLGLLIRNFGYKNPPPFFDSVVISKISVSHSKEIKGANQITTTTFNCRTKDGSELYLIKLNEDEEKKDSSKEKDTDDHKSLLYSKINIGGSMNLSRLPIIGKSISLLGDITISNLAMEFVTEKIVKDNLKKDTKEYILREDKHVENDLIYKLSVSGAINEGPNKMIDLNAKLLGFSENKPVQLPVHNNAMLANNGTVYTTSTTAKKKQSAISVELDKISWKNINKTIGPAHIGKLGIQLIKNNEEHPDGEDSRGSDIAFYVNLGISLGGIDLELLDLIIRFSINSLASQKIDPAFHLSGMSLSYSNNSMSFAGAFYSQQNTPAIGPYEYVRNYTGYLMFRTKKISMQLLGQYAKLKNTKTKDTFNSMFLFGVLNGNLGSTGFFSLEAIAIGGGYNSDLRLPAPKSVGVFPFIEMLTASEQKKTSTDKTNKQIEKKGAISEIMETLLHADKPWLTPKEANNWFAFGVKVNAYKLIDASVLLVGILKEHFELAVLGVAKAVFPKDVKEDKSFACIELFLKASLKPHEGVLAIDILISKNSFIIAKACHITGGVAFYSWFGHHKHSGDFVLSLGGYHPDFTPPSHFPKVERLGLNWQVSNHFYIEGGLYFAMTPRELMAGFSLNANYHNGNLKAHFSTSIDVLVQYHPFHYDVRATASLGASYTFGVHIHKWFVNIEYHKTVSIDISAEIHMWGPSTGLLIKFHIWKFSKEISYGDKPKPVGIDTLYKGSEKSNKIDFISMLGAPKDLISFRASDGLLESRKKQEITDPWEFRPDYLEIAIESKIPISNFKFNSEKQINNGSFTINKLKEGSKVKWLVNVDVKKDGNENYYKNFEVIPVKENLPKALWLKESEKGKDDELTSEFTVGYVLKPKKDIQKKIIGSIKEGALENVVTNGLKCPF